jgi:hypothetical protein
VDVERLNNALTHVERYLEALGRTLENGVARAIAMQQNAYAGLKRSAGDMRGTLAGLRQTTEPTPAEGSGLWRPSDG